MTYSSPKILQNGVPQGSCSGANIFTAYCCPIADTVQPGVELNGFADDHSIRKDFKANDRHAESGATGSLEASMESISKWMSSMRLKVKWRQNSVHHVWVS